MGRIYHEYIGGKVPTIESTKQSAYNFQTNEKSQLAEFHAARNQIFNDQLNFGDERLGKHNPLTSNH